MARDLVILAEQVRKRYRLGAIGASSLTDELRTAWGRLRANATGRVMDPQPANGQRQGQWFWALRGVDLAVHRGDVVGIVGRNGAGKSTLLKILSRITPPTAGTVRMRGRVSSLLEVGTGFHPELSGRENIFLNGAILGMRRREVAAKLDRIIAFSGIEHHIGTPIKRYSSGMKVRLGFAVAAHLDADILIVDEVLAVGDTEFQRKCLGRMRDVAVSGRTVLYVSHNLVSVRSLCTRAIWLDKGLVRVDGTTTEAVSAYLTEHMAQDHRRTWAPQEAPATGLVRLLSVEASSERPDDAFFITEPLRITIEFDNLGITDDDLNVRLEVRTDDDTLAFVTGLAETIGTAVWEPGRCRVVCELPANLLNERGYRFAVVFLRSGKDHLRVEDAIAIETQEGPRQGTWFNKWGGVLKPTVRWMR
jgi:lipopolysaccharide transport system ATP-binding protein